MTMNKGNYVISVDPSTGKSVKGNLVWADDKMTVGFQQAKDIVYGVHFGNDYEGMFAPIALCREHKMAVYVLLSEVEEANAYGDEYIESGNGEYRSGSDYIKIVEHELQ